MDSNTLSKLDAESSTIKDPRGDIRVFSKPPLNVQRPETPLEKEPIPEKSKEQFSQPEFQNQSQPRRHAFSIGKIFKILKIIGCWLPLILIIMTVIIILTKPQGIMNSIIDYFNEGIQIPDNSEIDEEDAKQEVNGQLTKIGENEIIISESQLLSLSKSTLSQLNNLKVDIEEGSIKYIWTLEESNKDNPLYGVIEMIEGQNEDLIISGVGTQKVKIPSFLNKIITDSIVSISRVQGLSSQNSLINTILPFDVSTTVNSIDLKKDLLKLNVNLNTGVF